MAEEDLVYDKTMDGESLIKEVLEDRGSIIDNNGKSYWWDTIDSSKRYQVRKYEYCRAFQYPVYSYKIKELQEEIEIISNNCPYWNECSYPCKNCPVCKKMFNL